MPHNGNANTRFQGNFPVSIIEGDGIGPEIAVAVKEIFAAAKVSRDLPSTEPTWKFYTGSPAP